MLTVLSTEMIPLPGMLNLVEWNRTNLEGASLNQDVESHEPLDVLICCGRGGVFVVVVAGVKGFMLTLKLL